MIWLSVNPMNKNKKTTKTGVFVVRKAEKNILEQRVFYIVFFEKRYVLAVFRHNMFSNPCF